MFVADTLVVIGLATFSLGTIQESDGVKEHTFWLRNAGQETVTLQQGYTSCGCTTIHLDKEAAVVPGDSTSVTLCFNPRGKGGEFEETGTVVYARTTHASAPTTKKYVNISLVGDCITSEETLMRQFPIAVSDSLRLSANRFDLGIMHVGESKERGVVILHRDEQNRQERIPITFTVDARTQKGLRHIPYTIKVGQQEIVITLDVVVK